MKLSHDKFFVLKNFRMNNPGSGRLFYVNQTFWCQNLMFQIWLFYICINVYLLSTCFCYMWLWGQVFYYSIILDTGWTSISSRAYRLLRGYITGHLAKFKSRLKIVKFSVCIMQSRQLLLLWLVLVKIIMPSWKQKILRCTWRSCCMLYARKSILACVILMSEFETMVPWPRAAWNLSEKLVVQWCGSVLSTDSVSQAIYHNGTLCLSNWHAKPCATIQPRSLLSVMTLLMVTGDYYKSR